MAERSVHIGKVAGSIPARRTKKRTSLKKKVRPQIDTIRRDQGEASHTTTGRTHAIVTMNKTNEQAIRILLLQSTHGVPHASHNPYFREQPQQTVPPSPIISPLPAHEPGNTLHFFPACRRIQKPEMPSPGHHSACFMIFSVKKNRNSKLLPL